MRTADRVYGALWRRFEEVTGKSVDEKGYVARLEDNLLPGIDAAAVRADFSRGSGDELKKKILAVHSSAALAANTFGRWKSDQGKLIILGESGFAPPFLEWKPGKWFNNRPPNLDAMLESPQVLIGIESKLTEPLTKHKPDFSEEYKRERFDRCEDLWWELLEQMRTAQPAHLDVAQLVKHYLGLSNVRKKGQRCVLLYLYWEPVNAEEIPEYRVHRKEVAQLVERFFSSSIELKAMRYAELWNAWREIPSLRQHAEHLRARYEVAI